jgi:hypothetical protein
VWPKVPGGKSLEAPFVALLRDPHLRQSRPLQATFDLRSLRLPACFHLIFDHEQAREGDMSRMIPPDGRDGGDGRSGSSAPYLWERIAAVPSWTRHRAAREKRRSSYTFLRAIRSRVPSSLPSCPDRRPYAAPPSSCVRLERLQPPWPLA